MHFLKRLIKVVETFPDKAAVVCDNASITYNQLYLSSYLIAQQLLVYSEYQNKVCLILSNKSFSLYQSLLACFFSNLVYMPINLNASFTRNQKMIELADPDFIVIGECQFNMACQILSELDKKTVFVIKMELYELLIRAALSHHFVLLSTDIRDNVFLNENTYSKETDGCYLFFTSGSTGVPKGVPISVKNLSAYMCSILSLFRFSDADRMIQISDIAFDLSVHEILTAWSCGATLYVYDECNMLCVSRFIEQYKITHVFLVPSVIPLLGKQCDYFNLRFTSLKKIFFCGEIFPLSYARLIELYAPHALIVNLYGPTETTIACTYHFYRNYMDYEQLQSVPIGFAFPTVSLSLSDEGELLITGEQVFRGYWNSTSNATPVSLYHTGDYVSFDPRWGYVFQARKDDQWQIQGCRIEKNEIEFALRSVFNIQEIFVISCNSESNLVKKLVAFSTCKLNIGQYKKQLLSFIPVGAVPDECIQVDVIPRLSNGKVDYRSLFQLYASHGGVGV